jgi:hypothetical protein
LERPFRNEGGTGAGVAGVAGVQEFRSSGVQEFRSSGVQEFRSSGVQEPMMAFIDEFKLYRLPGTLFVLAGF